MEEQMVEWLKGQPGFGKEELNVRKFTILLVHAMNDALLYERGIAKHVSDLTGLDIKTVRQYLKKR